MQSIISIPRLRAAFDGRLIAPGDATYDRVRTVFYGDIDRRPAAIVRAADPSDVARVVALARDTGLELAVRSGGHSPAGHSVSDGGIVLDLRDLRALDIDVRQRTAWAQAGLTAGEYTTAAGAHGLTIDDLSAHGGPRAALTRDYRKSSLTVRGHLRSRRT